MPPGILNMQRPASFSPKPGEVVVVEPPVLPADGRWAQGIGTQLPLRSRDLFALCSLWDLIGKGLSCLPVSLPWQQNPLEVKPLTCGAVRTVWAVLRF